MIACGIRKVWAKEFKDMDKPAQIRRLKQLLADLGMKGRLSLEQAKAIKEKRELAQELRLSPNLILNEGVLMADALRQRMFKNSRSRLSLALPAGQAGVRQRRR